MVNIIVVFSSQKDGINIRNLLMRHGHNVVTVCTNGAAVSQAVDQMEGSDGIVVSGYKYQDMTSVPSGGSSGYMADDRYGLSG